MTTSAFPRSVLALLLLGTALAVAGCAASQTELAPAPGADEASGMMDAAVDRVEGVRMVVQSQAWPGMAEVKTEVTPLRVVIENDGSVPVRLRYDEFTLVGPQGQRYAALPPYGVEGSVAEPTLVEGYAPVTAPTFEYNDFYVAPYYASAYPTLDPYADPFYYDSYYYDRYDTVWQSINLPTEEMVAEVLPEGVLDPGGRVAGFLYFERVDPEIPRVRFRADLVSVADGDVFGEVSIPFTVNQE
jgi:hypothetical protein